MRWRVFVAAALVAAATGRAGGQSVPRGWDDLSPEEQRRAWQNYERYRQLPEPKRQQLERRYEEFRALPPEQQRQLRENYQSYRGLDPARRREFLDKYDRWKSGRGHGD
ncbi:MAG: DUF3106 domain-containing protein [Candidatus Binatia bacterium]